MKPPVHFFAPSAATLPLQRDQLLHTLGYKPGKTQITPAAEEALTAGIALGVVVARPVATLSYCAVAEVATGKVALSLPGLIWQSAALARLLRQATGVTLISLSLGPDLDALVRQQFAAQEYAIATVIDAVGTVLLQSLMRAVQAEVAHEAERFGQKATEMFCPGYADWDMYDLPRMTEAAQSSAIEVICNEACCLMPLKSVVGLIGWVEQGAKLPASGCRACSLTTCEYRRGER